MLLKGVENSMITSSMFPSIPSATLLSFITKLLDAVHTYAQYHRVTHTDKYLNIK